MNWSKDYLKDVSATTPEKHAVASNEEDAEKQVPEEIDNDSVNNENENHKAVSAIIAEMGQRKHCLGFKQPLQMETMT